MSVESLAVSIRRGQGERHDEFQVERRESQTVLDVVSEIQRVQDPRLSSASPAGSACAALAR